MRYINPNFTFTFSYILLKLRLSPVNTPWQAWLFSIWPATIICIRWSKPNHRKSAWEWWYHSPSGTHARIITALLEYLHKTEMNCVQVWQTEMNLLFIAWQTNVIREKRAIHEKCIQKVHFQKMCSIFWCSRNWESVFSRADNPKGIRIESAAATRGIYEVQTVWLMSENFSTIKVTRAQSNLAKAASNEPHTAHTARARLFRCSRYWDM